MSVYAIVFKNKNNNQVLLSRESNDWCCIFSEYTSAANVLVGVANRLRFLLDGQPEERGNFLAGFRTTRKPVRNEDKENWERILKTLEIKRISNITFEDSTVISKAEEEEESTEPKQTKE